MHAASTKVPSYHQPSGFASRANPATSYAPRRSDVALAPVLSYLFLRIPLPLIPQCHSAEPSYSGRRRKWLAVSNVQASGALGAFANAGSDPKELQLYVLRRFRSQPQ